MSSVKRLCRVCMVNEWNGNLVPIFQNQMNNRTASDIFLISGVQIIDYPSCPALICFKCIEDLSRAIIFRNRCKSAEQFLRDTCVNNDLHQAIAYDNYDLKNEQHVFNAIKTEPLDSFFSEYPSITAEAVLNENSLGDECDDNQEIESYEEETLANNKKKFNCGYCKQSLSSEYSLKYHLNVVHGKTSMEKRKQFTCEVCGKSFAFKSKYTRHYRNAHVELKESNEVIGCHYCMKLFDHRTSLKDHIRYKHEVYDFNCDGCGKSFTLKNKLSKHFRESHTKARPRKQRTKKERKEIQCFPCVICGKICASKTFLKVHEKSHIKIRPEDYFYCDLCGNKFRSKNPLELHVKTRHILKLRYTCDKCPGKSWARKDHMKRHVKVVHENIRDFKCEWCGKDFPEKRKLECHIRIHTGERPFNCGFCGKKYTHETDYRRHVWSHTGERKYKCTSCRIAFNKRSELIAHRSECVYYNYNQNNVNI